MTENKNDAFIKACKNANTLQRYLQEKAEQHNHYKYYTKDIIRLLELKEAKVLYLSSGEKWNDILDRKDFNRGNTEKRFAKCFSYSREESVAMWMLYGGIQNKGGMIDFTRKGIQSILGTQEIDVGYFENGRFTSCKHLEDFDFRISITDVIYYRNNEGSFYARRGNDECVSVSKDVMTEITFAKKKYGWNYENECRLIVTIEKAKLDPKWDTVKIDLNGTEMGISLERIYKSPNNTNSYPGVKESVFKDDISWDLCKGCKK